MQITIHLTPAVAAELQHGRADSPAASELMQILSELEVQLKPVHPGSSDTPMASIFTAQAKDMEHVKRVVSRLRDLNAIEAAYFQPPPGLP
jgi:(p)ppGpp synthase/HD superfamily hydrolase